MNAGSRQDAGNLIWGLLAVCKPWLSQAIEGCVWFGRDKTNRAENKGVCEECGGVVVKLNPFKGGKGLLGEEEESQSVHKKQSHIYRGIGTRRPTVTSPNQ